MKKDIELTVYTMAHCPACTSLKRWLNVNEIPFVEKDIHQDDKTLEEFLKAGYRYTPTTLVKTPTDTEVIVQRPIIELKRILLSESTSK